MYKSFWTLNNFKITFRRKNLSYLNLRKIAGENSISGYLEKKKHRKCTMSRVQFSFTGNATFCMLFKVIASSRNSHILHYRIIQWLGAIKSAVIIANTWWL